MFETFEIRTSIYNMESNDLRKIICVRKSEVSCERFSVFNVDKKVEEHGIHCLPCTYTNDIINPLPLQL